MNSKRFTQSLKNSGLSTIVAILVAMISQNGLSQDEYTLAPSNTVDRSNAKPDEDDSNFLDSESSALFDAEGSTNPGSNESAPIVAPPSAGNTQGPVLTPEGESSGIAGGNTPALMEEDSNPEDQPESYIGPLTSDHGAAPMKRAELPAPNEFAGVPAIPGSRKNLARGQAPEFYIVEPGDTLFDICSQLIDDGNYWPRLWSLNPEIKNPHFIYPGMKLAFYAGDFQSPPYLDVVEEDDVVPLDKGAMTEAQLIAQGDEIPELPKSKSNVASVNEPIEIIGPESVDTNGISDMFENGGSVYSSEQVFYTLPGFIVREEKESLGDVFGGVRGELLSGDGVVVKIDDAYDLTPGTVYTVLRERGVVSNPHTGDEVGIRYDYVANIRIMDKVDDESFIGVVANSYLGAMQGDIIVKFLSTKRSIDSLRVSSLNAPADATIVNLSNYNQDFGGEGSLVFLDRGGLQIGSAYPVFQKNRYMFSEESGLSSDTKLRKKIGAVKILDSSENSSVAVIVNSLSEIRVGDKLVF